MYKKLIDRLVKEKGYDRDLVVRAVNQMLSDQAAGITEQERAVLDLVAFYDEGYAAGLAAGRRERR